MDREFKALQTMSVNIACNRDLSTCCQLEIVFRILQSVLFELTVHT